jgi:hypothetical protein
VLESLALRYSPVEDRLELRVRSREPAQEYRYALTRRVTLRLAQQLAKAVELSAEMPAHVDPAVRRSISLAHHEAVASQASIQRGPGAGEAPLATGEAPVLASRIDCGRSKDGRLWLLRISGPGRTAVALTLAPKTLHGLVELLRRRLAEAQWGVELLPGAPPGATGKATPRMH